MISVEQWRRSIGLFGGHRKGFCKDCNCVSECERKQDPWTELSCRLLVCAFVLWTMYFEHYILTCVMQPNVNTLLLANDVESNPGPTVEEQIASLHNDMNSQLNGITSELSRLATAVKNLEVSLAEVKNSVCELKSEVKELDSRQHTITLDIDANSGAIEALHDRFCRIEDVIEHQEQYSRRENVILHGVTEDGSEDYSHMRKKVVDIFNQSVKCKTWTEGDIQRSHRLGKPVRGKQRPVIVRFHQFSDKLSVLKARGDLKKLSIGVSNDLTARQRQELGKLRENGQRGYYKNGRLVVETVPPESSEAHSETHRRVLTAQRRT